MHRITTTVKKTYFNVHTVSRILWKLFPPVKVRKIYVYLWSKHQDWYEIIDNVKILKDIPEDELTKDTYKVQQIFKSWKRLRVHSRYIDR